MRKLLSITLIFLMTVLGNSCKKTPEAIQAEYEQRFQLKFDQCAEFTDGLSLCLMQLIEDSRCPTDVQCGWEGQAVVEVSIQNQDDEILINMTSHPNTAVYNSLDTLGYHVELIEVSPYPDNHKKKIKEKHYEVTFKVSN